MTTRRREADAEREPTGSYCSLQPAALVLRTYPHTVRGMVLSGELPGGWFRPPGGQYRRWWVSLAAVKRRTQIRRRKG